MPKFIGQGVEREWVLSAFKCRSVQNLYISRGESPQVLSAFKYRSVPNLYISRGESPPVLTAIK